jgi:hypothetical protein
VCGIAYPTIGLSIAVRKGIINLLTKLLPCFTEERLHQLPSVWIVPLAFHRKNF